MENAPFLKASRDSGLRGLHATSKDLIPRALVGAAAQTPCRRGCILAVEKETQLSQPKEDSARDMGNMRWSSGQCGYRWEWPDRSYWIAIQSGADDGPTMVAGTRSPSVPQWKTTLPGSKTSTFIDM